MRFEVLAVAVLLLSTAVSSQGALNDPCPGLGSEDEWKYGICEDLSSCSPGSCSGNNTCCQAGSCGKACLPDLRRCLNTTLIIQSVTKNVDCLGGFIAAISQKDFTTYCSSLISGLSCTATKLVDQHGTYSSMCEERMLRYLKANSSVIFQEIQKALGDFASFNEDFVNRTHACKELENIDAGKGDDDDDDSKDKDENEDDWNTSCPRMDHSSGLCPSECSSDNKCSVDNDVCCNVGGDLCHACFPDLKRCANLDRIFATDNNCLKDKLESLLSQNNRDGFCSDIWAILKCSAQLIVRVDFTKLCVERIAVFIKHSPADVIQKIHALAQGKNVTTLRIFARDIVTECKESPLYEKPTRPVPDDVKECARLETIQQKAAECGRMISPNNAPCSYLKTLVNCIADKIAAGKEEHDIRKCAGEIYKFIEENQQHLTNMLRGLNSKTCEERESVCSSGLEPLNSYNCTRTNCPAAYICRNSYCCPEEKKGWCPKQERGAPAMCKERCRLDSQCEGDEKCCMSEACHYKTCMKMETRNKSQCDTQYENGRRQLERRGICGDGTSLTQLPNCQNTGFDLTQLDLRTERGHCVTGGGKKIRGSDFTGIRDCTKVREGKCPVAPEECTGGGKVENICQSNDFKCSAGEKCCFAKAGNLCVHMCVKAEQAPENVPDDCLDRKCCPITLCQDKKCPGDITAVCRINSCGGCKAEFYNFTGKVDCSKGVSLCRRKRAYAQEENAKQRKSDTDRLISFLNSRNRTERDTGNDGMTRDDDYSKMEREDEMKDEYGERRQREETLSEDEEDDDKEDGGGSLLMREYLQQRICDLFQKLNVCKNGGECKVGSGESFLEFCRCPDGYHGVLCEQTGIVLPQDTQCYRDTHRTKSLHGILMNPHDKEKMVVQYLFNKLSFPNKIMTEYTCDKTTGEYERIQNGQFVPKSSDLSLISYCVDTTTGLRIEGTPVTLTMSQQQPNCDLTSVKPDPMRQPRKCLPAKMEECASGDTCEYFWNQERGACEKGKAGHGLSTLNDCYDQCGMHRECVNNPRDVTEYSEDSECEMKITLGPKPCRITVDNIETDGCDYNTQYCNVEAGSTGHIGTCKDFPQYCLERPDGGWGDKTLGAYFFNAKSRKCGTFMYKGHGGNNNRFYSLHQCHTECSTRPYKFEDVVCPVPSKLAMSKMDKMPVDKCDNDYHCYVNQVCCSDDKVRLCTDPVQTCSSVRCSFYGACDQGKCVCRDCSGTNKAEVCGSDGKTYENECHLIRHSCITMQNKTIMSTGPCTECGETYCKSYEECENNLCNAKCPDICTEEYVPVCGKGVRSGTYRTFSNECKMRSQACTLMEKFVKVKDGCCKTQEMSESCMMTYCSQKYMPLCAYDTTEDVADLRTFNNPCYFKEAATYGRKIKVLYPGKCNSQCGTTNCEIMQTCMNNTCSCQNACTREYNPICAHSIGDDSNLKTFSNLCAMRKEACNKGQIYVIYSHSACKEPEPVFDCPMNRLDRAQSALISCNTETHAGCDTDMGEMCCPYGAGKKCLPKRALVRRKEMKSGTCPIVFGLNYDKALCPKDPCLSDADCGGDAKCCRNDACGNITTCLEPSFKDNIHCPVDSRIVSECNPAIKESGCPVGTPCETVGEAGSKVGVCCMSNGRQDAVKELADSKLCQLLDMMGSTCQNGGTCNGGLRSGTVCQCINGYYGHFCKETNPPSNPATQCQVVKTVLMALNKTGLLSGGLSWQDYLGNRDDNERMENRRKRRDDHMEQDERIGQIDNPFMDNLMRLIKHMGMSGIPLNLVNLCSADGHFRKEQCMRQNMSDSYYCYCVNPQTGTPIPNGPKAMRAGHLSCKNFTDNMGLQDFCLSEKPSMERCGDSIIGRFNYNPVTMDCEMFTNYGCNENVRNNFDSYKTCASACGVKNTSMSICSRVRCGAGKICRVKGGEAKCVDPDGMNSKFEPICDSEGKFHPKQCHGKVCACVNPETGETVAGSVDEGTNLQCQKEGGTVKPVRQGKEAKRCTASRPLKLCENGGDECNNCTLKQNSENGRDGDKKVNDDNVCTNCERCPAGQGGNRCAVPETYCQNKCLKFPGAECSFNTCTCKEEYKANDRVINCTAVQSQCLIEQHRAKQEERAQMWRNGGKKPENSTQILCTSSGGYKAKCEGNVCHCVNATDVTKLKSTKFTPDNINCESALRKTRPVKGTLKTTISRNKTCGDLNQGHLRKIQSKMGNKVKEYRLEVSSMKCEDGSVVIVFGVEYCESCDNGGIETSDLSSLLNAVIAEFNDGPFTFEVDGVIYTTSDASVSDFITAEELYGPVTDKVPEEDDNKTTIIIVVVVVALVVVVAIGIACYCYQKANKSEAKDIPFSDIQGHNNQAYGKA